MRNYLLAVLILVFPLKTIAASCAETVGTINGSTISYQLACDGGGYVEMAYINPIPDSNLPVTQFGGIVKYHKRVTFVSCVSYGYGGSKAHPTNVSGVLEGDVTEYNGLWDDNTCVGLPPRATDPLTQGYFAGQESGQLSANGKIVSGTVTYSLVNNTPTATTSVNGIQSTATGENTTSALMNAMLTAATSQVVASTSTPNHTNFDAIFNKVESMLGLPHSESIEISAYYIRGYTGLYIGFDSVGDVWLCDRDAKGNVLSNTLRRWGSFTNAEAQVGF